MPLRFRLFHACFVARAVSDTLFRHSTDTRNALSITHLSRERKIRPEISLEKIWITENLIYLCTRNRVTRRRLSNKVLRK